MLEWNKNIIRRIIQTILSLVLQGGLLFLCAWSVRWIWAWIFMATGLFILIINLFVLPIEVIEERGRKKENVKNWDKVLTKLTVIPLLGIYILAGFDYRLHWTQGWPFAIHIVGLALYFISSMIFTWSMVSNRFFSTMVRIQSERGHTVSSGGPYRFVRHPGYVGFIFMSLVTPLALGSVYALIASGAVAVLFFIRTAMEDRTLHQELAGYDEYAKKVKYRLLPGVW